MGQNAVRLLAFLYNAFKYHFTLYSNISHVILLSKIHTQNTHTVTNSSSTLFHIFCSEILIIAVSLEEKGV